MKEEAQELLKKKKYSELRKLLDQLTPIDASIFIESFSYKRKTNNL